ncbi:MAG: hypothetical protein QM785_13515 [Pyrinomonadaceae bacterium]
MFQNKAYTISFTEHPNYLHVNLSGDTISEQIIREYVADILAKCAETGDDRILCYRDIPTVMPEGTVYHTVSESLDALRGKKVALVNPHAGIDTEVRFGMTVAQNRGGNYASFSNIDDALEWLLK